MGAEVDYPIGIEDIMEDTRTAVEDFFGRFALLNNKGDFSAAVAQFADPFIAAGPQGAQCVKASDFALALPKRKEMFARFGCESMQLAGVDAHSLGARYSLAHTRWKVNCADERPAIFVDSTYVVDRAEERIVLYLAHQDILAILRERGTVKD